MRGACDELAGCDEPSDSRAPGDLDGRDNGAVGDQAVDDAALRREYRAWVRTHHPDRGGDPEVFALGVHRWQAALRRPAQRLVPGPVVCYRRHGPLGTLLRACRGRRRRLRVR
jgi:hypothetical protein